MIQNKLIIQKWDNNINQWIEENRRYEDFNSFDEGF